MNEPKEWDDVSWDFYFHIGNKIGLCGPVAVSYGPIWLSSEKGRLAVNFLKGSTLRGILHVL
jgi:hypothetical protein